MIALVLERAGHAGREPAAARPDQGRAHGACCPARSTSIPNTRATAPSSSAWRTTRPGRSAASAFETVKRLDAREEQARLARPGAGQQHLADRGARRPRPPREARDHGGFREARPGRAGALKLAGSAEFVESPAALPAFERAYGFKLPARPDRRPAGRRHGGDHARGRAERERRQRRHGLRHRRRDRGARPRRHGRHQGRADRLRAGAGRAGRRCCSAIRPSAGPRARLQLAFD